MLQCDPYRALAGPELDEVIHVRVMERSTDSTTCPAYSSDDKLAHKVLAAIRARGRASIVVGRTDLKDRPWFARFETNAMDGSEVFAGSFALAVCRMALLQVEEKDAKNRR